MAMKADLKVCGVVIHIEADDEADLIRRIAFFSQLPERCPLCEAPTHFFHRQPQGFDYYGLACEGDPVHEANFGIHNNEARTLFYKSDSWRDAWVYGGGGGSEDGGYGSRDYDEREAPPDRRGGGAGGGAAQRARQ